MKAVPININSTNSHNHETTKEVATKIEDNTSNPSIGMLGRKRTTNSSPISLYVSITY